MNVFGCSDSFLARKRMSAMRTMFTAMMRRADGMEGKKKIFSRIRNVQNQSETPSVRERRIEFTLHKNDYDEIHERRYVDSPRKMDIPMTS